MNSMNLLCALNAVEEQYLVQAERRPSPRRRVRVLWIAAAACLALLAGCVAVGVAAGWRLTSVEEDGEEKLRLSVETDAYPLGEEAQRELEARLSGEESWELPILRPEELEELLGIHLLTLPEASFESWGFSAFRDGRGGICVGGAWWQQPDQADPWVANITMVLDTEGGAIDLLELEAKAERFAVRESRYIEALGTDVEMYFLSSDVSVDPLSSDHLPETMRHNYVTCVFLFDQTAYLVNFSLFFGEEITAEEAFQTAASLLETMR
ncbi:MAG: hypothetical protein IJK63_07470 [Oscillospiraceae bacterium]|nr:hypothetical protein [Oscillospiraceae bacterium]